MTCVSNAGPGLNGIKSAKWTAKKKHVIAFEIGRAWCSLENVFHEASLADGHGDIWVVDKGVVDKGVVDKGVVDKGVVDKGEVDKRVVDKGVVDKGEVDKGVADKGVVDKGLVDKGVPIMEWWLCLATLRQAKTQQRPELFWLVTGFPSASTLWLYTWLRSSIQLQHKGVLDSV
jgi:hypothetical protein